MREFTDNTGRVWPVQVDVNAWRRMYRRVGNVQKALADADISVVADMLYAVCADFGETKPEEFDNLLDGSFGAAYSALAAEIADFIQKNRLVENMNPAAEIEAGAAEAEVAEILAKSS